MVTLLQWGLTCIKTVRKSYSMFQPFHTHWNQLTIIWLENRYSVFLFCHDFRSLLGFDGLGNFFLACFNSFTTWFSFFLYTFQWLGLLLLFDFLYARFLALIVFWLAWYLSMGGYVCLWWLCVGCIVPWQMEKLVSSCPMRDWCHQTAGYPSWLRLIDHLQYQNQQVCTARLSLGWL